MQPRTNRKPPEQTQKPVSVRQQPQKPVSVRLQPQKPISGRLQPQKPVSVRLQRQKPDSIRQQPEPVSQTHPKPVLFGFVYISEALFGREVMNSYLICQMFGLDDMTSSKLVAFDSNPIYNFSQVGYKSTFFLNQLKF